MSQVICYACKKPISGTYTEAYGNPYHLDHWTCKACGDVLGEEFHSAKDGVNALCENCYIKLELRCAHCNNTIRDKYVPEQDLKYHPDCYGKAFTRCVVCGEVIRGQFIKGRNEKNYHPNCFKCNSCGNLIERSYIEKNGKTYCVDCGNRSQNTKSAPRAQMNVCSGCGNTIDSYQSMSINVGEKNFHEDCFKCDSCGTPLVNFRSGNQISFVQKRNGTNLCNNCYGNKGKTLTEISVPVVQNEEEAAPPPPPSTTYEVPPLSTSTYEEESTGPRSSVIAVPPPPPPPNTTYEASPPSIPVNDVPPTPRASIRIPPPPPMPGSNSEPDKIDAVRLSVLLNQLDEV